MKKFSIFIALAVVFAITMSLALGFLNGRKEFGCSNRSDSFDCSKVLLCHGVKVGDVA